MTEEELNERTEAAISETVTRLRSRFERAGITDHINWELEATKLVEAVVRKLQP